MLESIYGTKSLGAGWKSLKYFKIELIKISKTLKRAVEKNAHGDTAHVKSITESLEAFEAYAKRIKSKDQLIGEIVGLLQSPAKNVISALKSGGNTIAGGVKTLSER